MTVQPFKHLYCSDDGTTYVLGAVAGYKMIFNYTTRTVSLYLLLRDVFGTSDNDIKYISDHLWINSNLTLSNKLKKLPVGIGDFVLVSGKPHTYYGQLRKRFGKKHP